MNNIIHAGGDINGKHYSNSYESIIFNIENFYIENKTYHGITIEIDIIKIKDGFVIAHTDYEHIYNYEGSFSDITFEEFNKLKVYNSYTPMNFILLKQILNQYPYVQFNLDIKEKGYDYMQILKYIKKIFKNDILIINIVPQIYCYNDFLYCKKYGFLNCMVGLWKYYDEVYEQSTLDFINLIQKQDINITGFSIDYKHSLTGKFKIIKNMIKSTIYLHNGEDKPSQKIIDIYNKNGVYFFL